MDDGEPSACYAATRLHPRAKVALIQYSGTPAAPFNSAIPTCNSSKQNQSACVNLSGTMCPFASMILAADQQSLSCPFTGSTIPSKPAIDNSSSSSHSVSQQQCSRGMLTPSSSSDSLTEHLHFSSTDAAECEVLLPSSEAVQPNLSAPTTNTSSSSSSSSRSSSSSSSGGTHQAWQLKRPVLQHDPKLTRRQLRQLDRTWRLSDVAQHRYCDDGWIAVDGKVYDITEHLVNHPGWDSGCQVTTVLSILAHLGTDCSEEFREIHRPYPVAWRQLQAYYVGELEE